MIQTTNRLGRSVALLAMITICTLSLSAQTDSVSIATMGEALPEAVTTPGLQQVLKAKFIEGNAMFMSLVSLALVLGLTLCIERIVFLTLSQINARRFMADLHSKISQGDLEAARKQCRQTPGPVAAICLQGLTHAGDTAAEREHIMESHGTVLTAQLEKGCSWIKLFIAIAPSLGFLGTVIGMVMAFDQIQSVGDFGPRTVAAGMKVALITTIFGIIVAIILQLFYNYILGRVDRLVDEMEEAAITVNDWLQQKA